jgi:hypothetical protein
MTPSKFVAALSGFALQNVFNPYADLCPVYDRANAAASRRTNLRTYLTAAKNIGVDTIWMGRDLGYRGGRRTGLALTDEFHLPEMSKLYPGCVSKQVTRGPAVAERTAAEIWSILRSLEIPPLLWNVFPFHPHEPGNPFSNRKFTARELSQVDELNNSLIQWLGIKRIVAIGQDAGQYAVRFGVPVETIRHPSYGGVKDFRAGMARIYELEPDRLNAQASLF